MGAFGSGCIGAGRDSLVAGFAASWRSRRAILAMARGEFRFTAVCRWCHKIQPFANHLGEVPERLRCLRCNRRSLHSVLGWLPDDSDAYGQRFVLCLARSMGRHYGRPYTREEVPCLLADMHTCPIDWETVSATTSESEGSPIAAAQRVDGEWMPVPVLSRPVVGHGPRASRPERGPGLPPQVRVIGPPDPPAHWGVATGLPQGPAPGRRQETPAERERKMRDWRSVPREVPRRVRWTTAPSPVAFPDEIYGRLAFIAGPMGVAAWAAASETCLRALLEFAEEALRHTSVCPWCNQVWRVDEGSFCGWCGRRMLSALEWLPSYASTRVGLRWVSRVVATLRWRQRGPFAAPGTAEEEEGETEAQRELYRRFLPASDTFHEDIATLVVRGARERGQRREPALDPWTAGTGAGAAYQRMADYTDQFFDSRDFTVDVERNVRARRTGQGGSSGSADVPAGSSTTEPYSSPVRGPEAPVPEDAHEETAPGGSEAHHIDPRCMAIAEQIMRGAAAFRDVFALDEDPWDSDSEAQPTMGRLAALLAARARREQ